MEDTFISDTPLSSSNPCYDDRLSDKVSVTNVTSHCMATANRPCDPRDFKKSRAYRFRTLDQNECQLDQKIACKNSMAFLDRSILTPITDGDQVNDINMTSNSNVEDCDVIVSEEAVVDLTITDSIDICMSETVEVMDTDGDKKDENRKEDILVVIEDKIEDQKQDNMVLVDHKIGAEEDRKEDGVVVVVEDEETQDKMEVEDRKGDSTKILEDILEAKDINAIAVLEEKNKMEVENRDGENTKTGEDMLEANDSNVVALSEREDKMETAEVGSSENNAVVIIEEEGEGRKENNPILVLEDGENKMETAESVKAVVAEEKEGDNVEVDKIIKRKDDKMEVEIPVKKLVKDTTFNIDSTHTSTTAVTNSTVTVSKSRVKSEPFPFNPEPIDDDLSLPSSKELSNQVLSNNFLRDIESLNDSGDVQSPMGSSMSRILNKPLIPSCSAFRSSVLSNVTSTVRSGSSQSVSRKQNTKDLSITKSPRKSSSPRKIVHKTPEKSVTKKPSVSRKSSESSENEKLSYLPMAVIPIKPKPVVEQVKKYSTRRTSCLDEAEETSTVKEKTVVKDAKLLPNKHTSLQSSSHKDKSKSKSSSRLNNKQTKSPSKTPTKSLPKPSPTKTTPTRTPLTRQSAKHTSSPHTLTSTTTRSHAKTMAKATASTSDPIPVWISWKCCLCSQGSSQDQLGFLYGPYKSQTNDCLSVGSKRTRDDTDNDSNDERQAAPELWVHEGCACWAPGVCLVGNELHGLSEAVKNAKDSECVGCHQPGATISCSNRGCKASFHYPCAIKSRCSLLPDQLLLLCRTHNTQEKTV